MLVIQYHMQDAHDTKNRFGATLCGRFDSMIAFEKFKHYQKSLRKVISNIIILKNERDENERTKT